ncbi:MAG: hypothetical protein JSS20_07325 [Proteobacteria bacterium]|nr:hypothetical protein [Pseudomonadota bacterium]
MHRKRIGHDRRLASDLASAPSLPAPEQLVGLGFRYWMLGRRTGEIGHWERTWNLYTGLFGLCGARIAVGQLSGWVDALCCSAHREIQVFPADCKSFCGDECLAVSMIAAGQHRACPAMRTSAFALIQSSLVDPVVGEAQAFADTLDGLDHRLSAGSIVKPPIPAPRHARPN